MRRAETTANNGANIVIACMGPPAIIAAMQAKIVMTNIVMTIESYNIAFLNSER